MTFRVLSGKVCAKPSNLRRQFTMNWVFPSLSYLRRLVVLSAADEVVGRGLELDGLL